MEKLKHLDLVGYEYLMGAMYYFGSYRNLDMEKACSFLASSASKGHVNAMAFYGIELVSEGCTKDVYKGLNYLRQAASNKHEVAMYNLFALYKSGKFVDRYEAVEIGETGLSLRIQ